ncbi:MAG: iron-containing alcohol dehydrogenase [Syntrophomonadaceae bacterium]|nr:iron-containing alcohol dehydrogenase [Syntrophomonadaceae bacterium]
MSFNFNNPTNLIFGCGALDKLGAQKMPGKKAMLMISCGKSTRANGYLDRTIEQLQKAAVDYALFDRIMENPTKDVVMEGAAFARDNACDFIVALGGGAVLDAASAIAAMATHDGDLWDYVFGGTGKCQPLVNKALPVVAIATTSGTGSELNGYGVISNLETKEKIGFGHPALVPVLAIVDPVLMLTVPPQYTAFQGFDALFHHTEVMIGKKVNIMSETLALSAIENIAQYLPLAVKDGHNLEARERVAYGSTLAGMTMQLSSTTASHSMEHSMSAYHHNLPHGAGLIIISEAFYRFFVERHACDAQFIKMARAMGIENADKPEDFITALLKLQRDCGVDGLKMSDYGFDRSESMILAKGARSMQGGLYAANPCELTDEDVAAMFDRSYR